MVNTFLICPNWILSAKILDRSRVWKQVVEARQILQLIQDLKYLLVYSDRSFSNWDDIKQLTSEYKQSNTIFLRRKEEYIPVSRQDFNDGKYDYLLKPINSPESYKPVKLGFMYHPIVRMWWSFTEALKYYINIHIKECLNRGYDPNISQYYCNYNSLILEEQLTTCQLTDINYIPIPDEITQPNWIFNPQLYAIHRSNLKRKDAVYYANFVESPSNGYLYELFFDPVFTDSKREELNFVFS